MRVVAGLTTIPSRIDKLQDTLQSLIDQSHKLDAIYLSIPYTSQLEDLDYHIPDTFNDSCHIIRSQDYGPITRLIGVLLRESEPDTIIVTFDDNKIYSEGLVEKLISRHKEDPNVAIGAAGIKIGGFPFYMGIARTNHILNKSWYSFDTSIQGDSVDILTTSPGTLYLRGFFPPKEELGELLKYVLIPHLSRNDDMIISGYLASKNIERRIYKMHPFTGSSNKYRVEYILSFLRSLYYARREGLFSDRVKFTRSKTITYPFVLILSIIIFLILFNRIGQMLNIF